MKEMDMPESGDLPDSVIARLSQGADKVIPTSCAVVILKDDKAYKVKKSVDFGFLNFTTVERRREALQRELVFNRATAGDIYEAVEEVDGEAVLVMRRFNTDAVLDQMSRADSDWTPDRALAEQLGDMAARFHAGAPVCDDALHADNTRYVIDSNRRNIGVYRQQLGAEAVDAYDAEIEAAYKAVKLPLLNRLRGGHIRRCHGDMHLGNILIEHGRPVLFDCIEFNDRLSQIDVLYDLAFLLMDLWVRGHVEAANAAMNAWLERASRLEGEGVYEGLKLLPLYLSVRAGVRCHVSANGHEEASLDQARTYLRAARDFLKADVPKLLAVGGLSGAGKSTRARALAPSMGRAPGAVILRSDEIRKRMHGVEPTTGLTPEAYSQEENDRTHTHMFALAAKTLGAGQSVILDATFREQTRRSAAEDVAVSAGVGFRGIWLDVAAAKRAERVAQRHDDVSDATAEIAAGQSDVDPHSTGWEVERP